MTRQEAQANVGIVIARADLSFLERRLAGELLGKHFGKEAVVERSEIHRALRGYIPRLSDFQFRVAKETLIEKNIPVGSSLDGWHMCANVNETEETAKFFEEKAFDLLHKAKKIREAGAEAFGSQLELVV